MVTSAPPGNKAPAVLVATCVGLMVSMFNSTLVNVILPAVGRSLSASSSQLQWISSAYTLCYAALLLPGGALGNRFGRRSAFLGGLATFVVGSLGCAIAPSFATLLIARVVQALGAAVMLPQTLAILVHEYADPRDRARAVGIWAGGASLGLSAGPVLGGAIVAVTTWRAGFVLSAALALAACLIGVRSLPASRHGRPEIAPPADIVGALLAVVGLTALVFGLIESAEHGWTSPLILGALLLSVVALAGFLLAQAAATRRGEVPLMPLHLWRRPVFVAANLGGFVYFLAFFGILYFFSILLQTEHGYSALVTGLAFLPMTVVMALGGPIAGRLIGRIGSAHGLVLGQGAGAIGCLLLGLLPAHSSLIDLEWRLIVVGVGWSVLSASTSTGAVGSVDATHSGIASAVHNTCRQVGATMGVAALGVIVNAAGAPGLATGVDHAMLVVAGLLAVTAMVAAALARRAGSVSPASRPEPVSRA